MIYIFAFAAVLACCKLSYNWGYDRGYHQGELGGQTYQLINRIDLKLVEQIVADQGWTISKPEEPNEATQEVNKWVQ